ncbi:MAG: efflux RND transporter permease subunit [Phycisphaerales bacterium]|nr:efflux RND transporter permease subunit [Phycisphaerales bacterium]
MTLPELCIKRPVFTTMLILLPVVLGIVGFMRMGVDLFPNIDLPIVFITTTRAGASAEEMETGVTKKIEEAVNTLAGVDELSSTSKEGISTVSVRFLLEKNRDVAQQEVQSKINAIISQLPSGTDTPIIDKLDFDAAPVMSIAVSGTRSLREVTEIADKQISQSLSSLPGVGSVILTGGLKRAIQITVDTDKLRAYNLGINDVRAALENQNLELPGGRVDQNSRELTLRTMGRISDTRDFNQIIITSIAGHPIRISDVGQAADSVEEPRSLALLDGRNTVNLTVQKQSGTNTVTVIETVKERLKELKPLLAAEGRGDIETEVIRDQSRFIKASIHEVEKHLVLGAILVSLTILLFLRDWRTMIMAGIAIPVSIIGTFMGMYMLGFTLNNITMLALVMAVGIVIDDAVVVHENIFRWMEEKGLSAWDAALGATKEIALAVMATTFSLVVIFLPIAFMSGIIGRFFQSFGLTMVIAIMVSLLISFTLTPMLCSRFLRLSAKAKAANQSRDRQGATRSPDALPHGRSLTVAALIANPHRGGVYGWIAEKPYLATLRWSLRHRWVIVLAAIFVVMSLFPFPIGKWLARGDPARAQSLQWANYPGIVSFLGTDFVPNDDQSEFEVSITTPAGYTLERSRALFEQIANELQQYPAVTHTLVSIGDTTGKLTRATGDVTQGTIYVAMIPLQDRAKAGFKGLSQFDLMSRARDLLKKYPDLRTGVNNPAAIATSFANADIEFTISGLDLDGLQTTADRIIAKMRQIPGLTDVDTTTPERNPELRVNIDRIRAKELNLDIRTIAASLSNLVGGQVVSDYKDDLNGEQYDVWLRASLPYRNTREAIENATIASPTAGLVQLSNVATLVEARGPAQIDHFQRQRKISIIANTGDYDKENQFLFFKWRQRAKMPTGSAVAAIENAIAELRATPVTEGGISEAYTVDFLGKAKTMTESLNAFFVAFLLSFLFMYMILAAQFESFVHPITILLAVPLTIPFAILSLILLNQSLNLFAIIGTFLLFGVVKKNGILQVDYTNTLRRQGHTLHNAVLEANKTRLRPILMTTCMLVAGMIPIALGQGDGAASRASMAKVIIGGQSLSLLLTLLVTPVAYTLFDNLAQLFRHKSNAGILLAVPQASCPQPKQETASSSI